jgi:hypothetical protein
MKFPAITLIINKAHGSPALRAGIFSGPYGGGS